MVLPVPCEGPDDSPWNDEEDLHIQEEQSTQSAISRSASHQSDFPGAPGPGNVLPWP
jgi:hypothetical protein